jgi:hypothetical protein
MAICFSLLRGAISQTTHFIAAWLSILCESRSLLLQSELCAASSAADAFFEQIMSGG